MHCFIVGATATIDQIATLRAEIERLRVPAILVDDAMALRSEPSFRDADFALVLVPAANEHAIQSAITLSAEIEDGRGLVIAIADHIDPLAYKRLLRTQAGEWSTWAGLPAELAELARAPARVEHAGRAAKLISFLPSKGGVGNTTLAIETAQYLARSGKRDGPKVAILDLNLQGGTVADALDVEARLDLRALSENPERLDEKLVDVFTSRHSPRLDVYASPIRRFDLSTLDPAAIFSLIDIVARRYDALMFDIPHLWAAWIDNLLHGSDIVVATGGRSVPALRQLSAKLAYLDELALPPERIAVVVNDCRTTFLGRLERRPEIDRILPNRRLFFVRRDSAAADLSADAGRPVLEMAPGSRLSKDVHNLAQWIEATSDMRRRPERVSKSRRIASP